MSLSASSQLKNIMEKEKKIATNTVAGRNSPSPAANMLCPVLSLVSNPSQAEFLLYSAY